MSGSLTAPLRDLLGRRWLLIVLWFAEGCVAFAAFWVLQTGGSPAALISVAGFLLLCGAVLVVPAHGVRLIARHAGASPQRRRLLLELMLAGCAAATAAALGSGHGWIAIVCILLVGNVLWSLDFELRAERVSA